MLPTCEWVGFGTLRLKEVPATIRAQTGGYAT